MAQAKDGEGDDVRLDRRKVTERHEGLPGYFTTDDERLASQREPARGRETR